MGRPLPLSRARNRRLNLYLPGVILIIYKDDLRLMAPKPVAAKDGAMKEYRKGKRYIFYEANIRSPLTPSCLHVPLTAC